MDYTPSVLRSTQRSHSTLTESALATHPPAPRQSRRRRRRPAIRRKLITALIGLVLPLPFATTAQAAPEEIHGEIGCINNASPVGVWVQAARSKSGWADWKVPVHLGGTSKVDYTYTLNNGGPYQVHVGCGGRPQHWDNDIHSDNVEGPHDFLCNDINPIANEVWNHMVAEELFGVFGKLLDLSRGVPDNHCNTVG
jgi:hypothetical protein